MFIAIVIVIIIIYIDIIYESDLILLSCFFEYFSVSAISLLIATSHFTIYTAPASTANIALHKHVKQSDYYGGAVESSFSYLTDGKIINVSAHSSCVDVSPWFEVDLAKEYMLTEIVIHARPNWASRLEGFHMQLFDNKRIETDSYDYSDWNE
eukprot:Awhi_evm1s9552